MAVKQNPTQKVSKENMKRLKNGIGKYGETFDEIFGRFLDTEEDIERCLKFDNPQTEKLQKLKEMWSNEAVEEYLRMNSYNE